MATAGFPESVAELRAELRRLESELKRADAMGNRRASLNIIGQMIATQKAFMNRWPCRRDLDPQDSQDGQDRKNGESVGKGDPSANPPRHGIAGGAAANGPKR